MNAIILAAGMGTRLRPLTDDRPKCMIQVKGIPIIERQIHFLHQAGIDDVTLVSGYCREKLDYLKDNEGVDIVYNDKYDIYNNIYSVYKVLNRFSDSWMIEGDVFLNKNCFKNKMMMSTYFAKWHDHYNSEWGLVTDDNQKLERVIIGDGSGLVMSGISYWAAKDASIVSQRIGEIIEGGSFEKLFWDHAVLDVLPRLDVRVKRFDYSFEIDTVEDLKKVESLIDKL